MKQIVRRFAMLACAAIFLCGIGPIGARAITANYCEAMGEQVSNFLRFDDIGYKLDTPEGMMAFVDNFIPNRNEYGVGQPSEWGDYDTYSYPADVFEKWAHTFFNVETAALRQVTVDESLIYYNPSTNTYDREPGGKGGPPLVWTIAGYVENTDLTYSVYMMGHDYEHEPFQSLEACYEYYSYSNKVSKDNILFIDDGTEWASYEWIQAYNKVEISFDGTYVKYLSRTEIDSISEISDMITPDTPVDQPATEPPVSSSTDSSGTPTGSPSTQQPTSASSDSSVPTSSSADIPDTSSATSSTTEGLRQPSLVDDDTSISITGSIPDHATMSVTLISENEDTYAAIQEKLPEQVSRFQSYDINLLDPENAKVQPNGKVQISIPRPDGFGDHLAVYRTEEDGSMTLLDSEVKDDRVIFTTDHFSLYTIAEMENTPAIPAGGTVAIVIGALAVVAGGVTAGILLYKKKKSAPAGRA